VEVIERTVGHYEVQDVPYGKVYSWRPEMVVVECECGERMTLRRSKLASSEVPTCECGARCAVADTQEEAEIVGQMLEEENDKTVHPWRYWHPLKGTGIPF
jgi:hypothetical protein